VSYEIVKKILILFLVTYFVIGVAARFLSAGTEDFYPFFSWFLFIRVPLRVQSDFSIQIHEFGEKKFETPVFVDELSGVYDTDAYSRTQYHNLIQRLALSIKRREKNQIIKLREELEKKFILRPVVYGVVERKFNTIEHWKTGAVIEIISIAKFIHQ